MRWVLALIVLLLVLPVLSSAASMNCPTSVHAGDQFTIKYYSDSQHMYYKAFYWND